MTNREAPINRAPTQDAAAHRLPLRLARTLAQLLLGAFLTLAGVSHLTWSRTAFQAQVPPWLPFDADVVVVASGAVEIALGLGLLVLFRWRVPIGWVTAVFFLAIFPGNISQFVTATDSFGLNTDVARGVRLLFQPLLVIWALWSTGAWWRWRSARGEG